MALPIDRTSRISDPAPMILGWNKDAIAGFAASGLFAHSFIPNLFRIALCSMM